MDNNLILGFEFLLTAGVILTALILLLLFQKKTAIHQRLLQLFFAIIFCLFLNYYAAHHRILWLYLPTKLFYDGVGLLLGPLIYFYIRSIYQPVDFRQFSVWRHFIPYLFYWLLITLPFTFSSPEHGLVFDYLAYYVEYGEWMYWLEMAFLLTYTILAGRYWHQIRATAKSFYADFQPKDWLWSKRLLQGILIYIVSDFLLFLYQQIQPADSYLDPFINVPIILFIIGYLGYAGFFQAQVLIPSFLLEKENASSVEKITPASPKLLSSFSQEEIKSINAKLEQVLSQQQLYLNKAITLADLAQAVNLTDKKLSTFINQVLKTNFYELINEYRLAAFKEQVQLPANQNLTIWGIANQCGFKSKSTFHRFFKQKMEQTPSAYLQQIRAKSDKNS